MGKLENSPNLGKYIAARMTGHSFRELENIAKSYGEEISYITFQRYFIQNPVPIEIPVPELPKSPMPQYKEVVGHLSHARSDLEERLVERGIITRDRLRKLLRTCNR